METKYENQLLINGDLQIHGLSTDIFSISELALTDIMPEILKSN